MKINPLLEQLLKEAEDKAQVAALDQAMASAFQTMGSELKAKEKELKADVDRANIKVNEALTAAAILGVMLAAPKVVELMARALNKVVVVYKKLFPKGAANTEEEQVDLAKKIIDFTHKWHKSYIAGIRWILKVAGLYKKAGITDEAMQYKAAELVYYTLIASLAVYSGIGAISAFKSAAATGNAGSFSLGALESAMAAIKSGEVAQFTTKLGLKA